MHNRTISSSSIEPQSDAWEVDETRRSVTSDAQPDPNADRFAEMLAGVRLTPDSNASSSSAAERPYSLVGRPPVIEIKSSSFKQKIKDFHGAEIKHIAANSQEYSPFVSSKAKRTASLAEGSGTARRHTDDARYFSYELGNVSVGLLRTESGFRLSDVFEGEKWRELLPGRTEITSTTVLRITHPLVDNAGDILLEHQLRLDGERPLINSTPASLEAQSRLAAMGFVEVDDANMVLDPTQHPEKWTKNSDGEWQRANKPAFYLFKIRDGKDSDAESAASISTDSCDDDFDIDRLTHALDDILAEQ
ncbi:hypothetical protein FBZ93_1229 [Bradyrhizobium macuxiense]|uniref:Type III effector protein NopP n=1 Tax=Bradyrhizobium macuxiense TaxID=1755647 RepID=A0A560KVF0_9BRAD|nr:hypothetical protein [Bradyrhizobium macuxiense]TWB87228.1 hypothetical protein FBZ93_1229 [Bradyrhizobium macuxiense]